MNIVNQQTITENVCRLNYFLYCFQTKMDSGHRAFWVLSGIFVTRDTPIEGNKLECFLLFSGCNSFPLAENARKIKTLPQILERFEKIPQVMLPFQNMKTI